MTTVPDATSTGTGTLPGGWRWARLDEVCVPARSVDPRSKPEQSFHYIDISSVDNRLKRIVAPASVMGRAAPSRARQWVRSGDVIVATTRPNLNAVALVPHELDGEVCSTGFCVLRPSVAIDHMYLFLLVRTTHFIEALSNLVRGALYPAVTDGQVRAQLIPLAPISEQRRIAAILNEQMEAVERARAAAVAQLEAAKALPAAYLRAAFGSDEAHGWPRRTMGDVSTTIIDGPHVTPTYVTHGVPLLPFGTSSIVAWT